MNCGSTFTNNIKKAVKRYNAHLGISLDGDADRIIMSDDFKAAGDDANNDNNMSLFNK